MEFSILKNVTPSMWIMFVLGLLVISLYSLKVEEDAEGLSGFFKLTVKNIMFHIVGSLVVFLLLEEIGSIIIDLYFPVLQKGGDYHGMYHGSLSLLSGLAGSVLIAWIIQGIKNKLK